jgi:protein-S-isoprenylcysteine O-methyltransferase Ste14
MLLQIHYIGVNQRLKTMKKIISFTYGIVAYVVFLVAFLYAIGFVGNILVPKTINSGESSAFWPALITNLLLLSLFAIQHSIMARPGFKKWIKGIIGPVVERSTFVLLSSLILLLIYWQWKPITTEVWNAGDGTLSMVLVGLFYLGWLIVFFSTFMINHFELFGLKQIFENFKDKLPESPEFQTNYLYAIVRHPIMLGFIIAFWATPIMTVGHLIFSITTTLYIMVSVKYLEEKDLRNAIGKEYEDYQESVPMIIPFTKRKR